MITLADVLAASIVSRPLTDGEQFAVDDILDAAVEWRSGRLPLGQFAQVGKLPAYDSSNRRVESAGYARCLALVATPKTDDRRDALDQAIVALVAGQDIVRTKHGIFERQTPHEYGVTVR